MNNLKLARLLIETAEALNEGTDTIKDWYKVDILNKEIIDKLLKLNSKKKSIGECTDGYHTFDELYHHRAILFSVICNVFKQNAWKSKQHDDPNNNPMYDGMFIVGMTTPEGQATYHYDIDPYWELFDVVELDSAPKWDGHTPDDAINRIRSLNK